MLGSQGRAGCDADAGSCLPGEPGWVRVLPAPAVQLAGQRRCGDRYGRLNKHSVEYS